MHDKNNELILILNSFDDENSLIKTLPLITHINKYNYILSFISKDLIKGLSQLTKLKLTEVSEDSLFEDEQIYYLRKNQNINQYIHSLNKDTHLHLIVLSKSHLIKLNFEHHNTTIYLEQSLKDVNTTLKVDYYLPIDKISNEIKSYFDSQEMSTLILDKNLFIKNYYNLTDIIQNKQLLGTSINELQHNFKTDLYYDTLEVLAKNQPIQKEVLSKDHTPYLILISPCFTEEKKVIMTFIDLSYLKKNSQTDETLSYIIDNISSIIIKTDSDGLIEYVNSVHGKITGYNKEEVIGKSIKRFIKDEIFIENYTKILNNLKNGILYNDQINNTKKDGTKYYEDITIIPIFNDEKRLMNQLIISEDITQKKLTENTLKEIKNIDALTKLGNREYFKNTVKDLIAQAIKKQNKMAIFLMDINSFKDINDALGHHIGDLFLIEVARRLEDQLDKENILSRLGGDEFIFIIPHYNHEDEIISICKKIIDSFKQPFEVNEHKIYSSLSTGVVLYPEHGHTLNELLKNAEIAMYTAKNNRTEYKLFNDSMRYSILDRVEKEKTIYKGIMNKEFILYYQPIIDINTGQLTSIETLLRWHSKEKGILYPSYFLDFIEKTGQIIEIGQQTMMDALSKFQFLRDKSTNEFNISFNLSTKQLLNEALVENFMRMISKTKFNPNDLMIEITESITAEDIHNTSPIFKQFSNLGVSFSMDDFGTGYSSLGQLKNYPIKKVKIDKIFIHKMEHDEDYQAILKGIIALAHSMNYKVVAEGVESNSQLSLLKEYGCDEAQGYYICKPISFYVLKQLLQDNKGNFYQKKP